MASMDFPSFFKVLVHDSKSILRIPPLFVKTFEDILPEHALLKTKSGETWSVKMERVDVHYCFTDGWPKFVKDLELKMGDFLVFWLMTGEKSIFKVAIYGVTGCQKELNSATTSHCPIKVEPEAIDEFDFKTTRSTPLPKRSNTTYGGKRRKSKKIENPHFIKVLNKHHQSRLPVPLRFAKKNGLIGKTEVMMQYLNGWSTTVVLRHSTKHRTLDICGGWPEFRKKNRLCYGKMFAFEYIPETDSIRVNLIKKQA